MSEMCDKLRELRLKYNLTQEQLGEILGVGQGQIVKYEKGISILGADKIQKLIDYFNLPANFFFDDKNEPSDPIQRHAEKDIVYLPVFDGVPCGRFEDIHSESVGKMPTAMVQLSGLTDPEMNAFWCKAVGDSMAPKIKHGDMVLVANGCFIDNGDLVICCIDNMVTLKRFTDKGDRLVLIPENQADYSPIEIDKADLTGRNVVIYRVLGIFSKP